MFFKSLAYKGTDYAKGQCVVLKAEELELRVGIILLLFKYETSLYFCVKHCLASFVKYLGLYYLEWETSATDIKTPCVSYDDLKSYYPLSVYHVSGND